MKRLVVIGGGFAGASIAKRLQNTFDVTLIDSKDYFEFTPGVLRALVEPDHFKKIQVFHKNYLPKATVIVGKVTDIDQRNVIINGKTRLPYDYLVISSGSRYEPPIKLDALSASRAEVINEYHEKLENSKSVLIIGGGLVGIELAAEIVTAYPSKKIMLVHANERLAERMNAKVSDYVLRFLMRRGVQVIISTKVMGKVGSGYKTDKGDKIQADVAFLCTGIKPNSEFLTKHFINVLDEKGYVAVNERLQVSGYQNIFAVGDVNSIKEERTAQNAEEQVLIAAKNIVAVEHGEDMKSYVPLDRVMVVSLGKYDGVITYKDFVLTGFIAGFLKRFIEWRVVRKYK